MNKLNFGIALVAQFCISGAAAADIDFSGSLSSSCTLAITSSGSLALGTDGTRLASDESGGSPATLTVLSLGANTLSIAPPTLVTTPVGYNSSGQTFAVSYSGAGGLSAISQGYTSSTTTHSINLIPLSVLTVNARVDNSNGFPGGSYLARTVVTCS